jgi:DNA-binding transcriptional LysR family regulator
VTRSQCLRFDSELDIERLRAARRERYQRGEIHTPERDVLAACLEFLKRHPKIGFAVRMSSGVARYKDERGVERVVRYGFKGCPDLWAMLRGSGRLVVVEVKSDSGTVTPEQQAVLEAVSNGGGIAVLARSVDDVWKALA